VRDTSLVRHGRPGRRASIRRFVALLVTLTAAAALAFVVGPSYLWPVFLLPLILGCIFFHELGGLLVSAWIACVVLLFAAAGWPRVGIGSRQIVAGLVVFVVAGAALGRVQRLHHREQRLLAASSLTDRLTGLYNYGTFADYLRNEVSKVQRYGGTVALVMLDLDHFKRFNDRYGHEAGNDLLRTLGRTLRGLVRGADMAARYGGEEFAVLIRGDELDGVRLAERIRKTVLTMPVKVRGEETYVTLSAGVASYPEAARSEIELIELADAALYYSKQTGRNCVTGHSLGLSEWRGERRAASA
jgi:diguanylate cyclase (GGDEF)-like protein